MAEELDAELDAREKRIARSFGSIPPDLGVDNAEEKYTGIPAQQNTSLIENQSNGKPIENNTSQINSSVHQDESTPAKKHTRKKAKKLESIPVQQKEKFPQEFVTFERETKEQRREKVTVDIFKEDAQTLSLLRANWLIELDRDEIKVDKREFGMSLFLRYIVHDWLETQKLK